MTKVGDVIKRNGLSRDPADHVNAGWEALYAQTSDEPAWSETPIPIIEEVILALRSAHANTLCDVGCGDGRNLAVLAQAGFQCAGLDVSSTALLRARKRLDRLQLAALFLLGDCHALPISAGTLDAVVAFDVFGQLLEPERFVSSTAETLRPGGLLVLNAFTPKDSEYAKGEKVGPRKFLYKQCLFRFFERDELQAMFTRHWTILRFTEVVWDDPAHGDFRPYPHRHVNWFVVAVKKG